jgi:hypothetical protein
MLEPQGEINSFLLMFFRRANPIQKLQFSNRVWTTLNSISKKISQIILRTNLSVNNTIRNKNRTIEDCKLPTIHACHNPSSFFCYLLKTNGQIRKYINSTQDMLQLEANCHTQAYPIAVALTETNKPIFWHLFRCKLCTQSHNCPSLAFEEYFGTGQSL